MYPTDPETQQKEALANAIMQQPELQQQTMEAAKDRAMKQFYERRLNEFLASVAGVGPQSEIKVD